MYGSRFCPAFGTVCQHCKKEIYNGSLCKSNIIKPIRRFRRFLREIEREIFRIEYQIFRERKVNMESWKESFKERENEYAVQKRKRRACNNI